MTTPQEGTGTCCEKCNNNGLEVSGSPYCTKYDCPCHSPKEVQESTEEWKEVSLDELKKRDDVLVLSFHEKALYLMARTDALQEAAAIVRGNMQVVNPNKILKQIEVTRIDAHNFALEDAAQKIEALYQDKK